MNQFFIAEEHSRTEPRAIDHDRFGERHQIPRRIELANDDVAAEQQEVPNERIEIDGRLDAYRRPLDDVLRRKRMLARAEHDSSRSHFRRKQVPGLAWAR